MDHTHHRDCLHHNMKYCNKCQRPYCCDCGQEWFGNYKVAQSPYGEYYYDADRLSYDSGTTIITAFPAGGSGWAVDDKTPDTTCAHTN